MTNPQGCLLRRIATRSVVAALPVAMASAYASGLFIQPPRLAAEIAYRPVAEITVAPTTVGIADSPLYGMTRAQIDTQLDAMLSLGVTNIRVFVPWGLVEQSDNQYDWSHIQDVMDAAAARNMGVLAEINATPAWAAANPGGLGSILFPGADTPKTSAFVDFVKAFAGKYGNTVSAYEIWNEPNYIGFSNPIDPEAYAALLKAVYPVIKDPVTGVDPTATVVAGALGTVQTQPFGMTLSPVDFVQRMMAAGAGSYFDALSIHPYNDQIPITGTCPTCAPGVLTPAQQLDVIKTMIDGKKIWLTEYGVPTTPVTGGLTADQQSAWLKDLLDYWQTFGSQAGPVFVYSTRDTAAGSTNPEDNFGLFYNNWDPKTAATMLKAWIAAHVIPVIPVIPQPQAPVQNPIAQFLAALQQAFQSFTLNLSQLFNPLGFVQSFFQAITNLFGFGAPAPAAVVPTSNVQVSSASRVASVTAGTTDPTDTPVSQVSTVSGTATESHAASASAAVATPAIEAAVSSPTEPVVAQAESPAVPQVSSQDVEVAAATTESAPATQSSSTVSEPETPPAAASSSASSSASGSATEANESASTSVKSTKTDDTAETSAKTTSTTSAASSTSSTSTASSTSNASAASSTSTAAKTTSSDAKPKAASDSAGGGDSSSSGSAGGGASAN